MNPALWRWPAEAFPILPRPAKRSMAPARKLVLGCAQKSGHNRVTLFLALCRCFGRGSNRRGGGRLGGLACRVRRGGHGRWCRWGRGGWLFRGNERRRDRRDREIAF